MQQMETTVAQPKPVHAVLPSSTALQELPRMNTFKRSHRTGLETGALLEHTRCAIEMTQRTLLQDRQ